MSVLTKVLYWKSTKFRN